MKVLADDSRAVSESVEKMGRGGKCVERCQEITLALVSA